MTTHFWLGISHAFRIQNQKKGFPLKKTNLTLKQAWGHHWMLLEKWHNFCLSFFFLVRPLFLSYLRLQIGIIHLCTSLYGPLDHIPNQLSKYLPTYHNHFLYGMMEQVSLVFPVQKIDFKDLYPLNLILLIFWAEVKRQKKRMEVRSIILKNNTANFKTDSRSLSKKYTSIICNALSWFTSIVHSPVFVL
jgi:hypothetical protein